MAKVRENETLYKFGNCPACGVSWDVADTSKKTNRCTYSRLVGVTDPYVYDGVSLWKCPDCETEWDRWSCRVLREKENILTKTKNEIITRANFFYKKVSEYTVSCVKFTKSMVIDELWGEFPETCGRLNIIGKIILIPLLASLLSFLTAIISLIILIFQTIGFWCVFVYMLCIVLFLKIK